MAFFEAAKNLGDRLVVVVDSDDYTASKHKLLMPIEDRLQLVRQMRTVDMAMANRRGNDVSPCIEAVMPDVFCVGMDHKNVEIIPEFATCKRLGIPVVPVNSSVRRSSTEIVGSVFYDNPPVTVSAIIERGRESLLNKRSGRDGPGQWELIGGFLEKGETLEEALRRECREEATLEVADLRYFGSWLGTYSDGRKLLSVVFTCRPIGEPKVTGESLGFKWTSTMPLGKWFAECDRMAFAEWLSTRGAT